MKKIVLVLAVIIGILCINKTEKVIIPKESIRLRVIANSDYSKDQNLKKKIVKQKANLILIRKIIFKHEFMVL